MSFKAWMIGLAAAGVVALGACNDKDDDDAVAKALFAPDRADAAAHAALPRPSDLPGGGWEITAQDEFGDDDDAEVEEAFKKEPACKHLVDLAALGSIFGGDDEEDPAGRAQVELERTPAGQPQPTSVEMEIEVQDTVAEVERGWGIAKGVLTSDATKACFEKMVPALVAAEDPTGQLQVELKSVGPSTAAPRNGAALAFALTVRVPQSPSIEANLELYLWTYSNAEISLVLVGSKDEMSKSFVTDVVQAVDRRVEEAGD